MTSPIPDARVSFSAPLHYEPSIPLESLFCGCCIDTSRAIINHADATSRNHVQGERNAWYMGLEAPFSCFTGGGQAAKVPAIFDFIIEIATTIRIAIDTAPLGAFARVASIFALGYHVIDSIRVADKIIQLLKFRNHFANFANPSSVTDIQNVRVLKDLFYDNANGLESEHQNRYLDLEDMLRGHIVKMIFPPSDAEPGKFNDTHLIRCLSSASDARVLIQAIEDQVDKTLLYYTLTLVSHILSIVGLSLIFAAANPLVIIVLINTALAFTAIGALLWYCCVESKNWKFDPLNVLPCHQKV